QSPAPALDFGSDQGPGWQPENGFTLRWEIPAGQKAPIVGAVYRLHDAETGEQVGAGYIPGTGLTSLGPVVVPGVGTYIATIHLIDHAGNYGEPAKTTLRFDDRPP